MEFLIGILILVVGFQEYRIHRLVDRLLLQAHIPDISRPVPASPPSIPNPDVVETKRKLFSVQVPY